MSCTFADRLEVAPTASEVAATSASSTGASCRYVHGVAYDEELADRIRLLMGRRRPVEKKMFGGLAFLLGGHMAIAVSGQDGILVRVPPEQTNALRAEPGVHPFVMRDKPMTGWLRVGPDVLEDDEVLREWVERGTGYVENLPPKG